MNVSSSDAKIDRKILRAGTWEKKLCE
jgi:hypothetical protein